MLCNCQPTLRGEKGEFTGNITLRTPIITTTVIANLYLEQQALL